MRFKNLQNGVSLYLAVLLMSIMLALALGVSAILYGQIKVMKGMGNSVIAFYAANTGIERELYEKNYLTQLTGYNYSDFLDLDSDGGGLSGARVCPGDLIDPDDACYKITITSVSPYIIQSTGVFKETRRAIRTTRGVPVPIKVPILVLQYFPDGNDDGRLDPEITGMNDELTAIRTKVNTLNDEIMSSLEKGSTYRQYKNPAETPYLDYAIFDTKEFLTSIPLSATFPPFADHLNILNNLNICHYVDDLGVKDVWIWMYHCGPPTCTVETTPIESNMAMGTVSQSFWNCGTYGDFSNSNYQNDLPICQKTYTVYNFNYGRGLGEALEDYTHQIENLLKHVDSSIAVCGFQGDSNSPLFWGKFVEPYGEPFPALNHCGWTHSPSNTKVDYDWQNETDVLSDCEDWKPDGTGIASWVDCHTWYGETCLDDSGAKFKIWWMQSLPGRDNNLIYMDKELRNWWDFVGNFDPDMASGKNLTY